jgi:hypothetical protein
MDLSLWKSQYTNTFGCVLEKTLQIDIYFLYLSLSVFVPPLDVLLFSLRHEVECHSQICWTSPEALSLGVCGWVAIYLYIYLCLVFSPLISCFSASDTSTVPLVTLADIQCFIHKFKYTIHLVQTKICSTMIKFFVSVCDIVSLNLLDCTLVEIRYNSNIYAVLLLSIISIIDIYCL